MPTLSAKRPITIIVVMILIVALGIISLTHISSTLLPSFELPYVLVITRYPGAAPEKVETAVTKPVESAVSTVGGINTVQSVSSEGLSLVIAQFAYGTNMDSTMLEMDSNLDLIKGYFDSSVSSPMLMQIDPDMLPVMVAAADVDGMTPAQTTQYVNDTVLPALERVDGVASVSASGMVENTVRIELDAKKLDALQQKFNKDVSGKFTDGFDAISDAQTELNDQRASLTDTLKEQQDKLDSGKKQLSSAKKQLNDGIAKLEQGIAAIDAGLAPEASRAELIAQLDELNAQLSALKKQESKLKTGQSELDDAKAEALEKLDDAQEQLDEKLDELKDAKQKALDGADVRDMVSASMVKQILSASNFSMPAGYVEESDGESASVKVGNPFASIGELEELMLFSSGLDTVGDVYIKDVANIVRADSSDEVYARVNGNNGILITIQKQSSASTTEVTNRLRAAMAKLEGEDAKLTITQFSDQGVYINIIVDTIADNLLMGAALAVIILLVFLRSVKPTFIVALSIPISLLLTVTLMYFTNITFNIISLAGLALSIGMLVDNSIVVIDNIYRLRLEGVPTVQAAIRGTKEVGGAIVASTLTTVCVFLPIVFMEGISRELFTDMGLTILYALMSSLLVAMTLVPALGSLTFEKLNVKKSKFEKRALTAYEASLRWVLKHKAVTMIFTAALLAVSVYGALSAGTAFMPKSDSFQLMASVTADEKLKTSEQHEAVDTFVKRLGEVEGVETVGALEGGTASAIGFGGNSAGSGKYTVYALLKDERENTSQDISREIAEISADLPITAEVTMSGMDMTALTGSGVEVALYCDDLDVLRAEAQKLGEYMRGVDGIADVDDGVGKTTLEYAIEVDKAEAMKYQLTVAQVYQLASTALTNETEATTLKEGALETPLIVVKDEESVYTPETLGDMRIKGTLDGESVTLKLSDIAAVSEADALDSIRRSESKRTVSVTGSLKNGYNIGKVSASLDEKLKTYSFAEGVTYKLEGENEMISTTLSDLTTLALIAVLLIYLIMAGQFQSFLSPFIVMFTLPLAFTGGFLLLWACGFEVSVIAMLGLIVLLGVVVNNGIVFVDCANQLYGGGLDKTEALVETGRRRIRPILMTALTTILGLVTLCFGIGMGADLIQPMAVVIVGGLTYGTLMTLYVIPALYMVMRRKAPRVVIAD